MRIDTIDPVPDQIRRIMHSTKNLWMAVLIVSSCHLLSACGAWWLPRAHRIDIQQGNILPNEAIAGISEGMTRAEVVQLLGSPVLSNRANASRWDYLYSLNKAGTDPDAKRLTLFFGNGQVIKIEKEGFAADEQ